MSDEEGGAETILGRRPSEGKGLETVIMVWPFGSMERRLRHLKQNEQEEWLDKRLRRHSSARLAEPCGL